MDAPRRTWDLPAAPFAALQLSRPAGRRLSVGIVAALALVALLLAARALSGAFAAPLPAAALCVTGLAAVLTAYAARLLWRIGAAASHARRDFALNGAISLSLLLLALALSWPGGELVALAPFWALFVATEAATWRMAVRRGKLPASSVRSARPAVPSGETADAELCQQISRGRAADGRQTAYGWLRVEFQPGQRTAFAHVAICPSLPNAPLVTVRQTSGPEARVKAAQVLPYGIRFEIKLAAAAERTRRLRLDFTAEETG